MQNYLVTFSKDHQEIIARNDDDLFDSDDKFVKVDTTDGNEIFLNTNSILYYRKLSDAESIDIYNKTK